MASQQAWDDTEKLRALVSVLNNTIDSVIRGSLIELNTLFNDIVADQNRLSEDVALADLHPTLNSTYLTSETGKLLALREYLIASGFILE